MLPGPPSAFLRSEKPCSHPSQVKPLRSVPSFMFTGHFEHARCYFRLSINHMKFPPCMSSKAQVRRQVMNRTITETCPVSQRKGPRRQARPAEGMGGLGCGGGDALCCERAGKDGFAGKVPREQGGVTEEARKMLRSGRGPRSRPEN